MSGKRRRPPARAAKPATKLLDLSEFASLEDALAKTEPGERYGNVAALLIPVATGMPMTLTTMCWQSAITRVEELQQAIVRETRAGNPHAVFPLVRAFAETVVLLVHSGRSSNSTG